MPFHHYRLNVTLMLLNSLVGWPFCPLTLVYSDVQWTLHHAGTIIDSELTLAQRTVRRVTISLIAQRFVPCVLIVSWA